MRVVEGASVGDVTRIKPQTRASRGDQPRFGVIDETAFDVLEPSARHDGYAVPPALSVVRGLIPQCRKGVKGELFVVLLGLLDQHHIGLVPADPLFDARPPRRQRIDVPGGDLHGASARMNNRSASTATWPSTDARP